MPIKGKQKNPHLVVKYKKAGLNFEILCHPGTAKLYREGKCSLEKTIAIEEIFKNSGKYDKVKDNELQKAFATNDRKNCLLKILNEGTFPLSKEENTELITLKKNEIINYLHKYYWDATKTPPTHHPLNRLEGVLDEMKIKIDPLGSTDSQLREIVKKITDFVPCSVQEIPPEVDIRTKHLVSFGDNRGSGKSNKSKKGRR